ncbi:MAG: AraC family transcriptional regulator [Oscillospiraceae bacterium]|nr:AraC family transcriptional regulator [Oscillospiraceae bacterium]
MENAFEKRGYLLEDFRLFHLNDAQGTDVDFHYHEFCKLLLLRSGSGGYTVDGQRYQLEAGDVVLIDSHCVHRPEFECGQPYERIIVYISPDFLLENSNTGCNLQEVFDGTYGHVLRPEKVVRLKLFSYIQQLEQELSTEEFGQEIFCKELLLRLIVEVGRTMRNCSVCRPKATVPVSGRMRDIQQYLDTHLTEDITIDQLADIFYFSKYHMMRRFRQETGLSIYGYLCERRLQLARNLISQGVSATQSCYQAGFGSYSAFTRAYGKRFGTTPTGRAVLCAHRDETFE